jgi:prenyltransferase beta subunit
MGVLSKFYKIGGGEITMYQEIKNFLKMKNKIISQLELAQTKEGSIRAYQNAQGDPLTTAETIYLLNKWKIKCRINLIKALQWLCNAQDPSGKWTTGTPESWETSYTAWAILALNESGLCHTKNIARAVSWLISKQNLEGGFAQSDLIFIPNTYSTAYASLALLNLNNPKYNQNIYKALKWLESAQNGDGGFGLHRGEDSEASLTAYVCHFLASFKDAQSKNIYNKAASWLVSHQRSSGAWTAWFENTDSIEGTAFTLFVLCLGNVHNQYLDSFLKGITFLNKQLGSKNIDNWICISLLHLANRLEEVSFE